MAVDGPTRAPEAAEDRRREMSGGAHFAALDGYRALAAVMVVVTHVAYTTGFVLSGGLGHVLARFDFGVPLFFLMSGFLLYRPWVRTAFEGRARPDLRRYAVRRAARILPLYWLVVVVTLALLPELQPVAPQQWWVHLLGLQIYQPRGALEGSPRPGASAPRSRSTSCSRCSGRRRSAVVPALSTTPGGVRWSC